MTPKVSDELEVFVEVGGARLSMRGDVRPEHLAAIMSAAALTLGSAAQIVLARATAGRRPDRFRHRSHSAYLGGASA